MSGDPTEPPSDAPTEPPTEAPTDAPTEAPAEAPTDAPSDPRSPIARAGTDDDLVAPVPREPPRALGILLALVAAGCLIAACVSHRWLANRHFGDFGYSPLSFEQCGARCESISNFQVYETAKDSAFEEKRVAAAFPVAGLITFIVLLLAAAGLVIAAAIAAAGGRPDLPIFPTTIALLGIMVGMITGCVFVATKPGDVGAVGVAWSFWAFGIGSVAGIAGAQFLARQIRPADPDLLHDAMNPDQF